MKNHFFAILETFVFPIGRGIGISANRMYRFFRHRPKTAIITAVVLIAGFYGISRLLTPPPTILPPQTRAVTLVRAGDQSTAQPLNIIGEIRSVKEALISADTSGTVAGVYYGLGDRVGAGTAIASLKNDRERAAVTQAEAALAKAKAGAAISSIGVGTASNTLDTAIKNAQNALQSARTTVTDSVLRRTDTMFTNPTNNSREFIITAPDYSLSNQTLIKRGSVQTILNTYTGATTPSATSALISAIEQEQQDVSVVHDYLTTLSQTLAKAIPTTEITESDIAAYRAETTASLSAVAALETSLASAEQSLKNAEANVAIAGEQNTNIGGENADVIAAQAALQNAKIALDHTYIRSPISGTINTLDLKLGDFVAAGNPVAYVTSPGALEVVAYVGSRDVGDIVRGAKATIEGISTAGTVTRVGTALDPVTKKAEVRISVPTSVSLVSGQSVTVSIERKISVDASAPIFLPLTTVKLTPDGAQVFTVSEDNKLEAHSVALGLLEGSHIQILSGLDPNWQIVTDARGLSDGEIVVVHE